MKMLLIGAVLAASNPGWAIPTGTATLYVNKVEIESDIPMEVMLHSAEVKPVGTVLSSLCGKVSKGTYTEVCLSTAAGKKSQYLELRNKSGATVYVRAQVTARPKGLTEYKGTGVDDDDQFPRYQVEKEFRLVHQE